MLSVKEVLSLVEDNGHYFWRNDPLFINILRKQHCNLSVRDIDDSCPGDIIPLLLKHSNYVNGIFIDERPGREIIIQLIHDLLEKKPYLQLTLTRYAVSWVVDCKFRLRNICVYDSILENLLDFGSLLIVEGNEIETFTFDLDFQLILLCFVSYFEHPNCRVKELTNGGCEVDMVDTEVLRNTLIRRVVLSPWRPNPILLPYKTGENEFETMLRVLHKIQGCLPVDLWRVIFYFL